MPDLLGELFRLGTGSTYDQLKNEGAVLYPEIPAGSQHHALGAERLASNIGFWPTQLAGLGIEGLEALGAVGGKNSAEDTLNDLKANLLGGLIGSLPFGKGPARKATKVGFKHGGAVPTEDDVYIAIGTKLPPRPFAKEVARASKKHGVDTELINSIISVESSGRANAFNPNDPSGGSRGAMQILLPTARGLGFKGSEEQLFNPAVNIDLGAKYLAQQLARYGGNWADAIAAYNSGSVSRKDGKYKNQKYVNRVARELEKQNVLLPGFAHGGQVTPIQELLRGLAQNPLQTSLRATTGGQLGLSQELADAITETGLQQAGLSPREAFWTNLLGQMLIPVGTPGKAVKAAEKIPFADIAQASLQRRLKAGNVSNAEGIAKEAFKALENILRPGEAAPVTRGPGDIREAVRFITENLPGLKPELEKFKKSGVNIAISERTNIPRAAGLQFSEAEQAAQFGTKLPKEAIRDIPVIELTRKAKYPTVFHELIHVLDQLSDFKLGKVLTPVSKGRHPSINTPLYEGFSNEHLATENLAYTLEDLLTGKPIQKEFRPVVNYFLGVGE